MCDKKSEEYFTKRQMIEFANKAIGMSLSSTTPILDSELEAKLPDPALIIPAEKFSPEDALHKEFPGTFLQNKTGEKIIKAMRDFASQFYAEGE